jgi:hypothetical protein
MWYAVEMGSGAVILSRDGVTINWVWIGNCIFEELQIVTTNNYSAIANSHT